MLITQGSHTEPSFWKYSQISREWKAEGSFYLPAVISTEAAKMLKRCSLIAMVKQIDDKANGGKGCKDRLGNSEGVLS